MGQKQFEKQYGLTKNEILQKYPYEEWQASANEAKREKAKEDSKVQSDGERKEKVIQRIKGKQERISEQEEEISKAMHTMPATPITPYLINIFLRSLSRTSFGISLSIIYRYFIIFFVSNLSNFRNFMAY